MTARDEVVSALTAHTTAGKRLEGVNVIPFARSIDPPAKPTVLVRVDDVTPDRNPVPAVWRTYGFALILVPTQAEPGPADTELDALLEDVLYALDQDTQLTWTKATRATYQDTNYPAYQVDLVVPFTKE